VLFAGNRDPDVFDGPGQSASRLICPATVENVRTCETRLPRDPGTRRQTTTSAFPILMPAHLLTITSIPNLRPPNPYPAVEPGGITE
jgi:hypothetical protein